MSDQWELRIYDQKQLIHQAELSGEVEIGRQQSETEPLFRCLRVGELQRVVIASREDQTVSAATSWSSRKPAPSASPIRNCTMSTEALRQLC